MKRRQFCKRVGVATAGTSLLAAADSATATERDDEGVDGMVSAIGHFEETDDDVVLTDGHTETGYDLTGEIPGYTTSESPSDLLVAVHGVVDSSTLTKAREWNDEVAASVAKAGYDGPVVGFGYSSSDDFWEALTDAWSQDHPQREINSRSARKLAAFLAEYARRSPETSVHVMGHSGGGFVTLETIDHLREMDWNRKLASVLLLGAGVDDEMVAVDGRYGPAIETQTETVDSFYDPDDWLMDVGYSILRFDKSLGAHDVQGTPPENLETHNVDGIDDHDSYYRPRAEGGAGEDVVAEL